MNIKVIYHAIAVVLLVLNTSSTVFADEYVVSGNGDGSSNSINVSQQSSNTVSQENNAEIENNIESEASTGGNEANGNNGETEVETGDTSSDTTIVSEGNVNEASVGCCPDGGNGAQISGNGTDSNNSVNYNNNSSNTVSSINNASIKNNIKITANTGDNEASDNSGGVQISTGNIKINGVIVNKVNYSKIKLANEGPALDILISGNGSGSVNNSTTNINSNNYLSSNNNFNVINNILNFANTGNNKANNNLGNVKIAAGNITLDLIILNQANISEIFENCGCEKEETPVPSPTPETPNTPPSGGCCSSTSGGGGNGGSSGSSGGGSSSGSSSGSVLGASLPATGGLSILSLTILALLLLISGVILRFYEPIKQFQPRKIYREFIDNIRSFAFGIYLLSDFTFIRTVKTRNVSIY